MLSAKEWESRTWSGLMQWLLVMAGRGGMPGISMEIVTSQFPGWMLGWSAAFAARPPARTAPRIAEAQSRVLRVGAAWLMRGVPFPGVEWQPAGRAAARPAERPESRESKPAAA